MFKIRILSFFVFVSAFSSAQISKIEKLPEFKTDSAKSKINFKSWKNDLTSNVFEVQKATTKFYIPNAKPKDNSLYAALKGKKRDDSIYNIPNAIDKKLVIAKK
jgi:hypothetical protein